MGIRPPPAVDMENGGASAQASLLRVVIRRGIYEVTSLSFLASESTGRVQSNAGKYLSTTAGGEIAGASFSFIATK